MLPTHHNNLAFTCQFIDNFFGVWMRDPDLAMSTKPNGSSSKQPSTPSATFNGSSNHDANASTSSIWTWQSPMMEWPLKILKKLNNLHQDKPLTPLICVKQCDGGHDQVHFLTHVRRNRCTPQHQNVKRDANQPNSFPFLTRHCSHRTTTTAITIWSQMQKTPSHIWNTIHLMWSPRKCNTFSDDTLFIQKMNPTSHFTMLDDANGAQHKISKLPMACHQPTTQKTFSSHGTSNPQRKPPPLNFAFNWMCCNDPIALAQEEAPSLVTDHHCWRCRVLQV